MDKQLNKRLSKRQRLYSFIGKQSFAKDAYNKKKAQERKDYLEIFKACLEKVKTETNHTIYTLPILNWWRLHDDNDLRELFKQKREINKMEANCLNLLYTDLRKQYFLEFGFGEDIDAQNELIKEIIELRCNMIINDDISLLTDIEIAEAKLKKMQSESIDTSKASLLEIAANVKKICQVDFNINTCTVGEFFTYIKMVKKAV